MHRFYTVYEKNDCNMVFTNKIIRKNIFYGKNNFILSLKSV